MAFTQVLYFIILTFSAVSLTQGTFFFSTDHVDKVLGSEEYLVMVLDLYFALDAPDKSEFIHDYAAAARSANRENYRDTDALLADPVVQVRVLKRLSIDWQKQEKKLSTLKNYNNYGKRLVDYLEYYPSKKDFSAACQALFHYQEILGSSINELKQIHDFEDLTVKDYYAIGNQAYRMGDLRHAAMWLEAGLEADNKEAPDVRPIFKLIEIYNATGLVDNCARIMSLCQTLRKLDKVEDSLDKVYRMASRKIKAAMKEDEAKCLNLKTTRQEKCLDGIDKHYYEHKPNVPAKTMYTTDAFLRYKHLCTQSGGTLPDSNSYCRISQLNPFYFAKEEIQYQSCIFDVIKYVDVIKRDQLIVLLAMANGRLDFKRKTLASAKKFSITQKATIRKLTAKMAPFSKMAAARIDVELYLLGDLKFPSEGDVIEGGRTQIVCFLNVGEKSNQLVLPSIGRHMTLEPGSCMAVKYAESMEALQVQHSICPMTDGEWIMTITL